MIVQPQLEKREFEKEQEKLVAAFKEIATIHEDSEPIQKGEDHSSLSGVRGILIIPKIDVEMLIFEGVGDSSLRNGVGMIEPDKEIGVHNIGLAGHRGVQFGKQFNRLDELVVNDEIHITQGTTKYTFIVKEKFVVDRTRVDVLEEMDTAYLTLVTCTPIGVKNPKDRLIVQAILKSKDKEKI
ncbi:class D sortase [Fredinandcohnia humi]